MISDVIESTLKKAQVVMELYQLKTFVTVADEGQLTRASERLHTSQPAVSAHIKSLEEELGVTLFIRTPKGMTLTREGEVLREKAITALDTISALHQKAAALKKNVVGTARIGLHIDPRYLRIDRFLSYMRQHYPDLDFYLQQKWTWQQPEAIRKGQLEGGFVYGVPDSAELETIALKTFNVVVVGPAKWADKLAGAGWEEIAQMPWIWTPPDCSFCRIAAEAFRSRNLKPMKVTVADQESLINTLVSAGLGLSFMMEEEAREAEALGSVTIWDKILDSVDLGFMYDKRRVSEPMLKAVIEAIRQVWTV